MSQLPTQQERLPVIPEEQRTHEQAEAVARLTATPRGGVRGPFQALLHSPELLNRTQSLGEFLRYQSSLPQRLREFAILLTARFWNQGYEWSMHAPIAVKAGLGEEIIACVAEQRRPDTLDATDGTVFDFVQQLHVQHAVSQETFGRAKELFGYAGIVELCGICGYYSLLAMVMNVAHTAVPSSETIPFSPPEE